jgi:hypothetical protein
LETPERKRRGRAWPRWLLLALLQGLCASLCAGAAWGDTVWLRRRSMDLAPGLELDFYTQQIHGVSDTYTSRVRVERVDRDGQGQPSLVRFAWRMFEAQKHRGMDQRGVVTTSGLARGRSFNAWWGRSKISTSDTHLWLSVEACRELEARGQTRFGLDRKVRRDDQLSLRRVRSMMYHFSLDGARVQRRAWELVSEKGDRLWVLASCEHPLVLEADIKGLYLIRLRQARTAQPAWR